MQKVVSLFSGLGGLDLGLESAGWDCVYAADIDPRAVESLHANQGSPISNGRRFMTDAHIEVGDVQTIRGDDILAKAGQRRGSITLLAGGPPCQSWSSAGHQLGFDDPRGQLIKDYLRIASELDCSAHHASAFFCSAVGSPLASLRVPSGFRRAASICSRIRPTSTTARARATAMSSVSRDCHSSVLPKASRAPWGTFTRM